MDLLLKLSIDNSKIESMQRKDIKIPTIKKLFALSGNICAFPGCNEKIVDDNDKLMGKICHIEAAEKGGPRYNEKSNNEERRSLDNLILLCPNHHQKIDSDTSYTVDSLKKMKLAHQNRFLSHPYSVSETALANAMINYQNEFKQLNVGSETGIQINIQADQFSYQGDFKEEEELSIVDEIFDYVLNEIKEGAGDKFKPGENLNLTDKIKLNFKNEEEQEEVIIYAKAAILKRDLIKQKYQSSETEKQKDLHSHIFGLYKEYKRAGKDNIEVLTALFKYFTPKNRVDNPTYVNLAKALILFFFEDCTIFEKTKSEQFKQKEFDF
jgi:hypothetical protein